MANSSKNPFANAGFKNRLFSAVILVTLALVSVISGGIWFSLITAIFAAMLLMEWKNISDSKGDNLPHVINVLALLITISLVIMGHIKTAGIALFLFMLLASFERARRGSAWRAGFGIIYLLFPALLLILLRQMPGGLGLVLFIFTVVWSADTGAYLLGNFLKGPKLWPEISPNKTWSGFFGGILLGTFCGVGVALVLGRDLLAFGFLALVLTIVSAGGDLLISRMKRHFGVKDTGDIIPGHGGVLDRMDAFLAAVLVASALIYEFPGVWGQF